MTASFIEITNKEGMKLLANTNNITYIWKTEYGENAFIEFVSTTGYPVEVQETYEELKQMLQD